MALTRVNFVVIDDEVRAVTLAPWSNTAGYSNVPSFVTGSDGLVYKSTAANGVDTSGNNIGSGPVDPTTDITGVWEEFATAGATGGGRNQVFYENDTTITEDYTITTGRNAMSAGPITIGSERTLVTLSSDGSTLTGTTQNAHGFLVGNSIRISNTTNYNGTYTITAIPSTTMFTINSSLNVATETSGTAERVVTVTIPDGSEWTVV